MAAEAARTTPRTPEWLVRAAMLSVFDIDWIEPDPELDDASEQELAEFLARSCERVVDASGTARWQLRDEERARVLRTIPRGELLRVALSQLGRRPDPRDPVEAALLRYAAGRSAEIGEFDVAELSAELQIAHWTGAGSGRDRAEIQARLEWLAVIEPLRRLADGFVGRKELLAECQEYLELPERFGGPRVVGMPGGNCLLIEGIGGIGKSSVLARLILNLPERDDLAVYISFDRGWLVGGGPVAIFDEIVRQAGVQVSGAGDMIESLRALAQKLSGRVKGWRDVASRSSQFLERIDPYLLKQFSGLLNRLPGGRLVIVLDTLEELARRDDTFSVRVFGFLAQLQEAVPQVRVVGAGRALPPLAHTAGAVRRLTGLDSDDALMLLRRLIQRTLITDGALREIVRLTHANPLSLRLAADVLNRTGEDPARMIAVTEGNVQGQLYSRLLEHIRDLKVRAIAHPGLVVRRITPEIIRLVLAEPCGIAPVSPEEAGRIFHALRVEATLCELSPDGDGALVHRQDVRAIMLPAIQRDRPTTTRAIHEAAVHYYAEEPPGIVARREELYHRLMLEQATEVLDSCWNRAAGVELATVIDEFPPRGQVYLSTKVGGLRLDPEIMQTAQDNEWALVVRPAALRWMDSGQPVNALKLVRERRGADGYPLLPAIEVEALERLGRVTEALTLAEKERVRAERRVDADPDLRQ